MKCYNFGKVARELLTNNLGVSGSVAFPKINSHAFGLNAYRIFQDAGRSTLVPSSFLEPVSLSVTLGSKQPACFLFYALLAASRSSLPSPTLVSALKRGERWQGAGGTGEPPSISTSSVLLPWQELPSLTHGQAGFQLRFNVCFGADVSN